MKSDTDSLDLVFESIKKKDKGDYVCKAYFDHGVDKHEVEKRFNLTVFSKFCLSFVQFVDSKHPRTSIGCQWNVKFSRDDLWISTR
jgi:hypothetical protein